MELDTTPLPQFDNNNKEKSMSELNKALEALKAPTPEVEKKYRVGTIYDKTQGKGTVLTYIDARYVQDTLDRIVGPENWSNIFMEIKGNLFCEITIHIDGESVSKMDCGVESNVEKEKGEASDAFKRAAVMFGIGRDLYASETMFADLEKKGDNWVLPYGWKPNGAPKKSPKQAAPSTESFKSVGAILEDSDLTNWDGSELIGFQKGDNKGKTYSEVDENTLNWIINDCKNPSWKSKAKCELVRRRADQADLSGTNEIIDTVVESDIPS